MKVLHIILFYYNRGGDNTYLFLLEKLLEKKGHKNMLFSMHHPQNFDSEYSKYFVRYINYAEEINNNKLLSGVKVLKKAVFSFEAKKNMERLIRDEKPDIVHVQSIHHHITPSIFYPIKKQGIPIIWTLHDYSLICPNTSFLSHGKVCEKCKGNKFYWAILKKCKKGSFSASLVAALETVTHRILRIDKMVDVYLTPSEFLKNKLIEHGFKKDKIICLNNFTEINKTNQNKFNGEYLLYVGRISEEKGLRNLINAVILVKSCKLKIVGDGLIKDEMLSYVQEKNGGDQIEFLGHRSHEEVIELIKRCKFVILPTESYENFPYSILETFACGKPVIGSRIGGIPELVKDYETGITFEPGNLHDLSSKIKYLIDNPDKAAEMGENARIFVEHELNAEKHYGKLIEIYKNAINNSRCRNST